MGLNITSNETFQDGSTATTGYVHICFIEKSKDVDILNLVVRIYKTKTLRDSDKKNETTLKGENNRINGIACTAAEWNSATKNGSEVAYDKLKTYYTDKGKTVTDNI